jgi:type I restriction enzyme M protein
MPPASTTQTTSQRLTQLIKSCRDIMRKDKGLNGELDRLPQLTWMLFLKFVDDLEREDEIRAALGGGERPGIIPPPYRWRDWAAQADGITGEELIRFISADEHQTHDGTRAPGLLAFLRSLPPSGDVDRRAVVRRVFAGVSNRMTNGYLMRDVLNKLDEISFTSQDEIHTLSRIYEGMLREMRDAAGDSGEFYTPRPLVEVMVKVTDPRLGETVLDPAAGTGGFLVEAYEHLRRQVERDQELQQLQTKTIYGNEPKSLPLMLCEMNLLLHGVATPNVEDRNSLAVRLGEIGDAERVDVILTNPPFGGEEEASIKQGFPANRQTSETTLLFLQLIMRRLRRPGHEGKPGGRAAVVVPNGTLFGDGVAGRIKRDLVDNFNLHTVLRLPNGVFAPYTPIPTNVLFFDRSGPTRDIWFYEHVPPAGRKNYTKTGPLRTEEFEDFVAWSQDRRETERAWRVAADTLSEDVNLDLPNPRARRDLSETRPATLVSGMRDKETQILGLLDEISGLMEQARSILARRSTTRPLGELVSTRGGGTPAKGNAEYWSGAFPWVSPKDMKTREIFDSIDHISERATTETPAKLLPVGSVLVVTRGMILAHTVPSAVLRVPAAINQDMKALISLGEVSPDYLCAVLWALNDDLVALVQRSTHDTRRLQTPVLLGFEIPLPTVADQQKVTDLLADVHRRHQKIRAVSADLQRSLQALDNAIVKHELTLGATTQPSVALHTG